MVVVSHVPVSPCSCNPWRQTLPAGDECQRPGVVLCTGRIRPSDWHPFILLAAFAFIQPHSGKLYRVSNRRRRRSNTKRVDYVVNSWRAPSSVASSRPSHLASCATKAAHDKVTGRGVRYRQTQMKAKPAPDAHPSTCMLQQVAANESMWLLAYRYKCPFPWGSDGLQRSVVRSTGACLVEATCSES